MKLAGSVFERLLYSRLYSLSSQFRQIILGFKELTKGATVNGGNGKRKRKRKRKSEKGNGRHSNTYTVQAINARIGARAASLGVSV